MWENGENLLWTDLSMLLGHPLAERGGERAKCKAEVVAGILDEGSVIFNVQSNMHNMYRSQCFWWSPQNPSPGQIVVEEISWWIRYRLQWFWWFYLWIHIGEGERVSSWATNLDKSIKLLINQSTNQSIWTICKFINQSINQSVKQPKQSGQPIRIQYNILRNAWTTLTNELQSQHMNDDHS